jgi:hypothetical protein
LDGLGEEIGNSIFRKGHRILGLNADISGSGMLIQAKLLEQVLKRIDLDCAIEDKLIAAEVNDLQERIEYLPNIPI